MISDNAFMVPVADPVIAKTKSTCVDAEVDGLRELMRINIAAVRELINERHSRYEERFEAQEKAVEKSEVAQQAYNDRSNEFRAALDDQGKLMMPRTEASQGYAQLRDLIDAQSKLIGALQLTMSVRAGNSEGSKAMWGYVVGAVGFLGMLITIWLSFKK